MIKIALESLDDYSSPLLPDIIFRLLESAELPVKTGMHILVKPNLLLAKSLACTNPQVVANVCKWLLDKGVKVIVADSPGFGRVKNIASKIGLDQHLKPLGITVKSFSNITQKELNVRSKRVYADIATMALESDMLISIARIKAHSQMRLTMCVKNCFGCIPSLRKAFVHARLGEDRSFFAEYIAKLWEILPPVAAVADGIRAMHITGPTKGSSFDLNLLGACATAPEIDYVLTKIINVDPMSVPLCAALNRLHLCESESLFEYPLKKPEEFNVNGFIVPDVLKSASFGPWHLTKSLAKRLWKTCCP